MPDVLIASDADWVIDEVASVVAAPDTTLRTVRAGVDVLSAIEAGVPDLVILDLQIGNMGGMAACLNLRLEESADRLPHVPVLMLLDRVADVFLARRSQAEGWMVKPLDAIRLGKAVRTLLEGGEYHEGYTEAAPPGQPAFSAAGGERGASG
jgi:DNA-binding response OmpR family regulator